MKRHMGNKGLTEENMEDWTGEGLKFSLAEKNEINKNGK